jgi:hypothetical protein
MLIWDKMLISDIMLIWDEPFLILSGRAGGRREGGRASWSSGRHCEWPLQTSCLLMWIYMWIELPLAVCMWSSVLWSSVLYPIQHGFGLNVCVFHQGTPGDRGERGESGDPGYIVSRGSSEWLRSALCCDDPTLHIHCTISSSNSSGTDRFWWREREVRRPWPTCECGPPCIPMAITQGWLYTLMTFWFIDHSQGHPGLRGRQGPKGSKGDQVRISGHA